MRKKTLVVWIVGLMFIVALVPVLPTPVPQVHAQPSTIFSDNFDEYSVGSTGYPTAGRCSNYQSGGNATYWGGPAGFTTPTLNPCYAPTPQLGAYNIQYWNPAEGPACSVATSAGPVLGGCQEFTTTHSSTTLSPNACMAVVNPALDTGWTSAHSGTQVMKICEPSSDDKQEAAVQLDHSVIPNDTILNMTMWLWLPYGFDNMGGYTYNTATGAVTGNGLGHDLTFEFMGIQITYRGWLGAQGCVGTGGQWRFAQKQNGQIFAFAGCYLLTPFHWHEVSFTLSMATMNFTGMSIDDVNMVTTYPSTFGKVVKDSNLNCSPWWIGCVKPRPQYGHYVTEIGIWMNSGNNPVPPNGGDARASMLANQSIYDQGSGIYSNASYVYIDDYSFTDTPLGLATTTNTGAPAATVSAITNTTSSTIAATETSTTTTAALTIGSTPVQTARGTATSGTTVTVTLGSTPASGHDLYLVMGSAQISGLNPVSSIGETGVTWNSAATVSENSGTQEVQIWAGSVGPGAGTGITVTMASTVTGAVIVDIYEWTGASLTVDKIAATTGSSSTGTTGTTATTSNANDLCIGGVFPVASGVSVAQSAPTNSFTLVDGVDWNPLSTYHASLAGLSYVQSVAAAESSGTTIGNSGSWVGVIATFEASSVQVPEFPFTQLVLAASVAVLVLFFKAKARRHLRYRGQKDHHPT